MRAAGRDAANKLKVKGKPDRPVTATTQKNNHQAQRGSQSIQNLSMSRFKKLQKDSAAPLPRCKKLLMNSRGREPEDDETPNALRRPRRSLPPLRKACWLPLPLAEKLGDRGGDLRRTRHARFHKFQSVRHVDVSQGKMKHRGRKQDLHNQKPGGLLVSPSGGMSSRSRIALPPD